MIKNLIEFSDILVCIPAYNEASVIYEVIRELKLKGFERVLVVDDGSDDNTHQVASDAGALVVRHLINRGAGAATQTGIEFARRNGYSFLIQMDGDGQHMVEDALRMKDYMAGSEIDILIGSRFKQDNAEIPPQRIIYNKLSNIFTNWFCIGNFSDSQSGFRMLNRKAIESIQLTLDGFGYCSEMIFIGEKAGLKIDEIPISVRYTPYSLSKGQNFGKGINTAFHLLYKFFLKRS